MSASNSGPNKQPYLHKGQMLSSPPLSARLRSFMTEAEAFIGLYVTTFFSFDPHASAQQWLAGRTANSHGPRATGRGGNNGTGVVRGWGSGSGSGGGGGPGVPGRRLGFVDDVRGPECKSCS